MSMIMQRKDENMFNKTNQDPCLSTIAVAALVGGLVGAVVGLMVAPKSGKALREGIQVRTDSVLERVGDVTFYHAGTIKNQGSDLAVKGKQLADDLQTFIQESLKTKNADIDITQSETFKSDQSEPPLQEK